VAGKDRSRLEVAIRGMAALEENKHLTDKYKQTLTFLSNGMNKTITVKHTWGSFILANLNILLNRYGLLHTEEGLDVSGMNKLNLFSILEYIDADLKD
jgi:hypothetical protein